MAASGGAAVNPLAHRLLRMLDGLNFKYFVAFLSPFSVAADEFLSVPEFAVNPPSPSSSTPTPSPPPSPPPSSSAPPSSNPTPSPAISPPHASGSTKLPTKTTSNGTSSPPVSSSTATPTPPPPMGIDILASSNAGDAGADDLCLFDPAGDSDGAAVPRRSKPLYLKDVNARHLLESGPDFDDDDDDKPTLKNSSRIYKSEQADTIREFLQAEKAVLESSDGDDFMKEKERADADEDPDLDHEFDKFFWKDDELDDGEKFLKEYLKDRKWIDKEKKVTVDVDVSEYEDALDKQEKAEEIDWEKGPETIVNDRSKHIEDDFDKPQCDEYP